MSSFKTTWNLLTYHQIELVILNYLKKQRFQVQNFSQIFFFLNPFAFTFLILFLDQLVGINYTPATVGA
jgi:hypothetical protein